MRGWLHDRQARRRVLAAGLWGVVVAALTAAIVLALPPRHRAEATLIVEPAPLAVAEAASAPSGEALLRAHQVSQAAVLGSREVALRAIRALKLWEQPGFDPRRPPQGWTGRAARWFGLQAPAVAATPDALAEAVIGPFLAAREVQAVPGSFLVRIAFEAEDPALALRAVQAMAEAHLATDRAARQQPRVSQLEALARERRQQLAQAEVAWRDAVAAQARESAEVAPLEAKVTALQTQLARARARRIEAEASVRPVLALRASGQGELSALPVMQRQAALQGLRRQEEAAQQSLAQLGLRYGPANPLMIQAAAEVEAARQRLQAQAAKLADALVIEHETARAAELAVAGDLAQARSALQARNAPDPRVERAQKALEAARAALARPPEAVTGSAGPGAAGWPVARMIDPPVVQPLRRPVAWWVGGALLLAWALGGGVAWVLWRLQPQPEVLEADGLDIGGSRRVLEARRTALLGSAPAEAVDVGWSDVPPGPRPTRADRRVLAVLALGTVAIAWQAVPSLLADLRVMQARALVRAWADGRAPWTVRDWVTARDGTQAALALTPANPTLHDQLGVIYLVRARDSGRAPALQQAFYREAARHQRAAIALRPGHGWTWAALAESLQALAPDSAEAWDAWREARRLAPQELPVKLVLYRLGARGGEAAPEDVQAWMDDTRAAADPRGRRRFDALWPLR
jgi:uncharacterized protein involved in exopolysaccharide biosynthesis